MQSKKLHLAISTQNIAKSVQDYTQRLSMQPTVVIEDEYALWRTDIFNLSIRKTDLKSGTLRHLGFEDETAEKFSTSVDVNGITWEQFNFEQQKAEIIDAFGKCNFLEG